MRCLERWLPMHSFAGIKQVSARTAVSPVVHSFGLHMGGLDYNCIAKTLKVTA
jgi:hypothetical protein